VPAEPDDLGDEGASSGDIDEDDAGAGGDEQPPGRTGTGVEAHDLDGTWVFTREMANGGDAALGGVARIDDGCLFVGDEIVVWDTAILADLEQLVADVSGGESIRLRFGGGCLTLDEGSTLDDFPVEVVERCDTRTICYSGWFERVE
jgi:hypothetical protein